MATFASLIDDYLAGLEPLHHAVTGLSPAQLRARPVAGKWSTLEVLAHVADMEGVFAERIKRIIAEEEPTFFDADTDLWASKLAYDQRDATVELWLIEATRRQLAGILRTLPESARSRRGTHSTAGPLTLEQLLTKVTSHLMHHVQFIDEKRRALGLAAVRV
jgi:uncharacterized damage-inducible protein DinB